MMLYALCYMLIHSLMARIDVISPWTFLST